MPYGIDLYENNYHKTTRLPCQTEPRDVRRLPEGMRLLAWQCQNGHITDVWAPVDDLLAGRPFRLGSSMEHCDLCEEAPTPADVHLMISQFEEHGRRVSGMDVSIRRKPEQMPPFDFTPWTPQSVLSYGRPCTSPGCAYKTYSYSDLCLHCELAQSREREEREAA